MCGLSTVVTPAGASLLMYRDIHSYANSIWDDNNNNNNNNMCKHKPGKVPNPARGQLNRETNIALSPFIPENLVPSHPTPAHSFSILRLNIVLTRGIPPAFLDCVHIHRSSTASTYTVNPLRVTHEFIGSRSFVPMALITESPPPQDP